MAITTDSNIHERAVNDLKLCAESICANAESIVGTEQYLRQLRVTINFEPGEATTINIDRDFYPEKRFSE